MKPVNLFFILFTTINWGCHSDTVKSAATIPVATSRDTVLLVDMGLKDEGLLNATGKMIASYYHLPIKYTRHPIPSAAFLKQRKRYDSNLILKELRKLHTGNYRFVAGLTSYDISTEKNGIADFGIFGLGSMDGGSCITSTNRLKRNADENLLYNRVYKVVLHEIGHNYGVPHCTNNKPCFMKDAKARIKTIDKEPLHMCVDCNKKKRIV